MKLNKSIISEIEVTSSISKGNAVVGITPKVFLKKLFNKLNIQKYRFLGSGTQGYAYNIGNDRVVKITSDISEANEAKKIKGKRNKHLSDIYEVYSLGEPYKGVYIIISEKLKIGNKIDELDDKFRDFWDRIGISTDVGDFSDYLYLYFQGSLSDYELKYVSDTLKENKIPEKEWWFYNQLMDLIKEVRDNGIKSPDFDVQNLGFKKDGNIAFFDLGYGDMEEKVASDELMIAEEENLREFIREIIKKEVEY